MDRLALVHQGELVELLDVEQRLGKKTFSRMIDDVAGGRVDLVLPGKAGT